MPTDSNPLFEPIPYDFRKPLKTTAKRDGLSAWPAKVAPALAAKWSEHLGCDVEISPMRVESTRYGDFIGSLTPQTCLSVIRIDPPGVQACVDLSPGIVFPMIDRLLGGSGQRVPPAPRRELTEIERGLALGIIERLAGVLADTLHGSEVREDELHSDAANARIMPADEIVSIVRLQASMNDDYGIVSICLPAPVIEMLNDGEHESRAVPIDRQRDQQNLTSNILAAAVELRALLAETKLRLSDVIEMQVGDVITTDVKADAPASVQVEGRNLFAGEIGHLRGTRAIEVKSTEDLS